AVASTVSDEPAPQAPATIAAATPQPAAPAMHDVSEGQPPAPANAAPQVSLVTVQPGHTLWAISQSRYGSGELYVLIYRANRSQIRDPDLIYPGQIFELPEN
ncbi:MAG: LysM peptidoglycan-binding domain-containing protein, partial [Rhodobacter sp.]|nr:LysM peptidoglycan-binding domain-containing protein [Rhodobacter sp.]